LGAQTADKTNHLHEWESPSLSCHPLLTARPISDYSSSEDFHLDPTKCRVQPPMRLGGDEQVVVFIASEQAHLPRIIRDEHHDVVNL